MVEKLTRSPWRPGRFAAAARCITSAGISPAFGVLPAAWARRPRDSRRGGGATNLYESAGTAEGHRL